MEQKALDYDYIFFDFDGTLCDSASGIMECIERTLREMGAEIPERSTLFRYIGPPLEQTFGVDFGFKGDDLDEVLRVFRANYREIGVVMHNMYDGVPEMLDKLKRGGKKLAIATSKREDFAQQICNSYGITDLFEILAGSTEEESRQTKEGVIEYIIRQLGINDRSRILMVGDRKFDVYGAKKTGIDCMGVLYGYGSRQELAEAGALYIAETMDDISKQILGE